MNPASSIPGSASEGLSEIQFDLAMMDDFPAMVWGMRLDGTVCYFSKTALAFSGETSGADWYERVHPEDRERSFATLHAAFAKRAPFDLQFRLRRHDGQYRRVVDRGAPMRNARGEIAGYLGVAHDVTEQHTTDELRRESARLVRILEATTDYVGMSSAEGQVLFLNAAGRKMLGIPPDEPVAGHIADRHPEWAREILKEAVPAAARDGDWMGETALLTRSGQEIPVSQVILAHPNPAGEIEFFSTIMRDLSDRKREEVARIEWANRYDAAIRASGQVLFDWNSRTNDITYAGDLERLLGYTAGEMRGGLETFRGLIHPFDLETFDLEVQRVTGTRDPFHLEFRVRHKDESYRCLEAKGYFFLDRQGQIGRMVGFFADVTAQRQAQEALAVAHEGLEARVAERTAELARAYRTNQDRALQQEAVAHLGHQALRGAKLDPLLDEAVALVRTILRVDYCSVLQLAPGGAELVATAQVGWPDAETGNRVPTGRRSQSGYTLLMGQPVIIADLATETRFEVSEAAAASGVVSGVSVIIEAGAAPLGVLCVFTTTARAFGQDDVHFLQAIANVLTEAIQRQRVEESIRQAHERAETASRVKSQFLSRMSHELRTPLNAILGFTQLLELDSPSPSQAESIDHISRAGKNLLSLINTVLDISRLETGEPALSADPVRMAESPPTPATVQPPPVTANTTHTLLYIEDQDLNLRLVERILQPHARYRLLTAMLGHLGLQLAREHHPDLILLDLNLPDISGDEVLRQLRNDPATRDIPILMVSADAMGERIQELLRQGATGYLTKPYKVAELLRVIERTLATAGPGKVSSS